MNRKKKIENTEDFHWDLSNYNDLIVEKIEKPVVVEKTEEELQKEKEEYEKKKKEEKRKKDIRVGLLIKDINVIRPHLRF